MEAERMKGLNSFVEGEIFAGFSPHDITQHRVDIQNIYY